MKLPLFFFATLMVSSSLAAPPPEKEWMQPEQLSDLSDTDGGSFGLRYRDQSTAWNLSAKDLQTLSSSLPQMSAEERANAEEQITERLRILTQREEQLVSRRGVAAPSQAEAMDAALVAIAHERSVLQAQLETVKNTPSPSLPSAASVKDMEVFGRSFTVGADQVYRDVVVFGGNLTVDGLVMGDSVVFGGSLKLGEQGRVLGDAVVFGGTLSGPGAESVGGDSVVFGGQDWSLSEPPSTDEADAEAEPAQEFVENAEEDADAESTGRSLLMSLAWPLSIFGGSLLALALFPRAASSAAQQLAQSPGLSAVVGTLSVMALGSLGLVLFFTCILSPLALLLYGVLGGLLAFGLGTFAELLGEHYRHNSPVFGSTLFLALIVLCAQLIGMVSAILGTITLGLIAFTGVGAFILSRRRA